MKQALYYSIRKNLYDTVVAVTSEKGTRRWHGRDCQYNEVTHGTFDQLRGRFKTQADAEACRSGIRAISDKYKPLLEQNIRERNRLYKDERLEVEEFIKANTE
jgi:hypothetical protein